MQKKSSSLEIIAASVVVVLLISMTVLLVIVLTHQPTQQVAQQQPELDALAAPAVTSTVASAASPTAKPTATSTVAPTATLEPPTATATSEPTSTATATAEPEPTVPIAPTTVEETLASQTQSAGLGLSRATIQRKFETAPFNYTFVAGPLRSGRPAVIGTSSVTGIEIEIIGNPDDVHEAQLQMILGDQGASSDEAIMHMLAMLEVAVPDITTPIIWLEPRLERAFTTGSSATLVGDRTVTIIAADEIRYVLLSVIASPPPNSPAATEVPQAPAASEPTPVYASEPITFSGFGNTVTDPFVVPFPLARVTYDQTTDHLFQVRAYPTNGETERLIVNEIGDVIGAWLFVASEDEYYFEIEADGNWSFTLEPLDVTAQNLDTLSGVGPWVTDLYRPARQGNTPYLVEFQGDGLAQIRLHCNNGTELVLNEIDSITSETVVDINGDLCFWEIEGDGTWSFTPR